MGVIGSLQSTDSTVCKLCVQMQAGVAAGAYNTAADAASRVADKTTGTARQVGGFLPAQQCGSFPPPTSISLVNLGN